MAQSNSGSGRHVLEQPYASRAQHPYALVPDPALYRCHPWLPQETAHRNVIATTAAPNSIAAVHFDAFNLSSSESAPLSASAFIFSAYSFNFWRWNIVI